MYATLNHANRLNWAGTPLPHSLAYDSRLLVYNWFTRWLKRSTEPVREEPPVNPEIFVPHCTQRNPAAWSPRCIAKRLSR